MAIEILHVFKSKKIQSCDFSYLKLVKQLPLQF